MHGWTGGASRFSRVLWSYSPDLAELVEKLFTPEKVRKGKKQRYVR